MKNVLEIDEPVRRLPEPAPPAKIIRRDSIFAPLTRIKICWPFFCACTPAVKAGIAGRIWSAESIAGWLERRELTAATVESG
jgi:hypothetical protein